MNYKQFIETVITYATGLTYSASTGTSILNWVEYCLTDEPELDINTKYPAMFITPIPMTIPKSDMTAPFNFKCRLYILDSIGLDRSQRLQAYSNSLDIVMLLINKLDYTLNWNVQLPVDFVPILFYDANVDGGFVDLSVLWEYNCPI